MQPSHVFGLNATVDGNISYIDDQTVLYPAGSQLIQYHLEQKTQKFIGLTEGDGISAMQVCPSGSHVAVGMRSIERTPFVVVCDLQNQKRRKVLVVPEGSNAKDFISVCFSNDARLVLAQTGAPDWQIFCWSWEKQKLMSAFKSTSNNNLEIRQMSCNPYDNMTTQICVTGDGIFRSFRQTDGNFKLQFQQKPDKDLLCHSWISESRVVAGTQDAKLLIFDGGDLLLEISHLSSIPHPNPSGPPAAGVSGAPASTTNQASLAIQSSSAPNSSNAAPTLTAFTAIVAFAGGILAGTSAGTCVLFERSDDSSLYRKSKIFATEACAVHSVALCPAEDAAVCTLKNSQVYAVALDADSSKGDEIKCDRLFQPFHHGNVVGMDTCARKPLLATCGTDRSLRIWNYAENSLEVIKYFHDEPLSVALHPSGLYVLVGFSDSLKLMNVLIDDIRPFWESSIRGCRECQFSNGGQYFASVYGSAIGIHSTWTFETIGHLKGHSGKVRSIAWSADDSRIVSCGLDGNIFDWNVKTLKRETEVGFPGTLFSSVGYGGDGKVVYAVGSDGTIKEIADGKLIREFSNKTGYSNLRISRSGKLMFAATNKGAVRMFRLPLPADGSQSDVSEASCHASGITRLRTSFDETYVFSCSEDGCVWVYRALDRDPRGSRREKEWIFSDEILVTKSDLKDTHRLMTELKQKVDALKTDNESHLRLKDLTYAEKLNDLTEKYLLEIDSLKHLTSSLSLERQRNERDHLAEMEGLKAARTAETLEAETAFRAKMRDEEEKYRELSENLREVQEAWEKQMADVESFQSARVQQITEFYKGKLEERQLEMNELRNQLHRRKSEFSQHIQEIEDDADQEILTLSYGFETKLAAEHGALASIRDENNAMHGDYDKLMREISENKSGLNRMYAEDRRLLGIIKGLEKDVLGVKREMQERDDTIQDKEKRISDLKKKNQELEKFKFVLDYKIAELKKQQTTILGNGRRTS
ncbi:WD repeat domain 65-like protein [Zopfochytrium polystomum]|nr:WD repeat domain 65-like protein [Zopfochytrium polystomum]